MIVLLTGGCKNGKSDTAQEIACSLRSKCGGGLYYVATMESTGKEDDERIRKHVENRAGLGFETIEIARDIKRLSTEKEKFTGNGGTNTFLVDSLTALLAGEMFRTDASGEFIEDLSAAERVCEDIKILCREKDYNLIFVSDGIYSDAAIYDASTDAYRGGLALIERVVAGLADEVIEMCSGKKIVHKSEMGEMSDKEKNGFLIVGGAGQGKLEFAKRFAGEICDKDIFSFEYKDSSDYVKSAGCGEIVPNGYKIYCHAERLMRGTDESAEEIAKLFFEKEIVICEDITCGIVPIDAVDRKWREDAGRLMQALAANRRVYRVICGIGEEIG
ncbi:MAG: bifunctional adenosylcobinamide kinase/adenosylcobinamide-phosphate guanylyltransferase [Butyrivibrio sp.]|nr:bifunctional adenosylcobinamide kinase/adenosylcobinamide-phosphate guanylyltransferase [Butyrivibrio sp.]